LSSRPQALLADATWYGTLAAARDLGAHGVAVTLASDRWVAPARWSRHVARTVSCPSSKHSAQFLRWLLRFGAEHPGHVLYPTSDDVAWLVAAHAEKLSRCYRLYTPRIESLAEIFDKPRLVEHARAVGLEAPETRVPRDASEVEKSGRELGFPLYVKPRSQVLGEGLLKGVRVDAPAALLRTWQVHCHKAKYDAEVLDRVPDLNLPMLQSLAGSTERIYTVDGFVDETGDLYTTLACVKTLQRPRGSGPGIVFEHAEVDPVIEDGLRRLFQATRFCGVFDAEFMECGSRKLLIDLNPRFYNHMAFEIDRGLHLAWLAYLAATEDREALKAEIAKANKNGNGASYAYIHKLPTALLLAAQRLARTMSAEDRLRWRRWISAHRAFATDPARSIDDPVPAFMEVALEAAALARHPRGYLRGLLMAPAPWRPRELTNVCSPK